ncbi:hypothetical protein [Bradyrhizobium sp. CB2312]|uniref:hypothetical protein n=1 Tax=Bradyrhizobium sp. CB2312 TaxID=3039155 RepID=UPI0024B0A2DF|nr:hypothetical protein [Bradyrhizobium sp. CB2312]WFU75855.1 hypothetical protein QA642_18585 [Bradyrhizobium sp. CB2312]
MHLPTMTAVCLVILAMACAALAFWMIRLRQRDHAIFNGGIVLGVGVLVASALPILSRLPWAELADEASDQAVAALHFLEVTYTILTL